MKSSSDTRTEVRIKIQETLGSINDITMKIKKELEAIEKFVKEDGHLHTAVNAANVTLSKKVHEMEMNVEEIISENKPRGTSAPNLLDPITSIAITENLLDHIDA